MVASIFGRLGYFAAEDPESELRVGDHHNPGGYWEAESLTRANAELFAAVGFAEDTTWIGSAITHAQAERIGSLTPRADHEELAAAYEARAPWVWKDPRLCYTLGYWWPLVRPDRTRVLLTLRDPAAIYQSFVRVKWREPGPDARADVLARVDAHLAAARAAIARWKIPHLEVRYEDFAQDPTSTARALSSLLDLDLAPSDLGFTGRLNRSSFRGRVATALDRAYERLPRPLRRTAKALAPAALMRLLYPERAGAETPDTREGA
jgi:hypothetical protein